MILIITYSTIRKLTINSWETGEYLFSNQAIIFVAFMTFLIVTIGIVVNRILGNFNDSEKDLSNENPNSGEEIRSSRKGNPDIINYKHCILPLLYLPYFAAFTGNFSNTVMKLTMNVMKQDVFNHEEGTPTFGIERTIPLFAFNICLVISNLYLLNKCIQYFEPVYIIPIKKVALLINNIL